MWYDAFRGKQFSASNIHYEKASVLFNIAALHAQLGCMQNRTSVDAIKASCGHFQVCLTHTVLSDLRPNGISQRAAGAFTHLSQTVLPNVQDISSPDLNPETLGMLCNLMLAQAQENVYEKVQRLRVVLLQG